jgi:hypothetical protein
MARVRQIKPRARELERDDETDGDSIGEVDSENKYRFVDYPNAEPRNIEDSILRDFGLGRTHPHGRGKLGGHYSADPFVRWGNKQLLLPGLPAAPITRVVKEFLYCELDMPAEISLRLSATADTAPMAGWTMTWTLLIGVGSAMQARQWSVPVTNTIGPPTNDVLVKFPIKVLRVRGSVAYPAGAVKPVTAVAHAAPTFPQFPPGAHR